MPQMFGSLNYVDPQNVYMGSPVDEAKTLNADMSTEYNNVSNAKNALDVMASTLDVEDRNFGIKQKAISDLQGQFSNLVSNGDYQNARFLVQKAAKNFQTNPEITGALQSKAQYDAYNKDLQDRLSTGKITSDIYSYGITKSKAANQNPLTYDPNTGKYNGIFNGQNVVDDMSGQIYDDFNKRIADWKEGSILNADGSQYVKSSNSPTGYFNQTTGKEVSYDEVKNALRTELENNGKYKDFLNQEATIDLGKTITNADGTQRSLSKDDLTALGYDDNMLKTAISGVSQDALDQLKASKRPTDQKEYKKQLALRDSVDTSALSQDNINNLYAAGYKSKQIDKYISPAANKASYRLYDNKYLEDNFGLENLKFQHDVAIKKLEEQKVYAPPTNLSATVDYTYDMYQNSIKKQGELNTTLNALKQKKADVASGKIKLPPEQLSQLDRDIALQQSQYDVLSKGQDRLNDQILDSSDGRIQKLAIMSGSQEGGNASLKMMLNSILSLPLGDLSSDLNTKARTLKNKLDQHQMITEDEATAFTTEAQKNTKSGALVNSYTKLKMNNPDANFAPKIADEQTKFFENHANISMSTNVLALDPNEKGKLETETQRQTNYWTNLLQSGTDFTTMDGKNLREIAGHAYDQTLYQADGTKLATPMLGDITKMSANLTTKEIDGQFYLQVPLVDGTGHQLYEQGSSGDKTPAYKLVKPADQSQIKNSLSTIGNSWLSSGGDTNTQTKGLELLGQVNFSDQLQAFKPSYLEDKVPFTMYSKDTPQGLNLQIVKINDVPDGNNPGQFTPSFAVQYPDGSLLSIKDMDGSTQRSSFTSKEELMTLLEYNFNH